jgi:hypothetical protein
VAAALCAAALAAGCGDDGAAGTTSGPGPGAGGDGGGAGGGGDGGAGGGDGCLDPSLYEDLFSIADPALCAVAVYTADVELGYSVSPTWGRHGGPLLALPAPSPAGAVEVRRLSPPAGATGALTAASAVIDAGVPADAYAGAQAIDLPFFDWTAISWAGPYPNTQGELILLEGGAIATRYAVNAFFSGAGLAAAGGGGRLLYTGLSALEDAATSVNGVYVADSCGAAGAAPRLLPEGDPTCAAPAAVAAWGDFSGPTAADRDGNAFVVLPTFAGDQEARGFAAASIGRGAGPTEGSPVFTLPGAGQSLAALGPAGGAPGLIAFQPTDPVSYAPLDPVAVRYTAAGDTVQAEGNPAPLLTLATPETPLTLMADGDDRLWVGAPSPGGGTTFVVLTRP